MRICLPNKKEKEKPGQTEVLLDFTSLQTVTVMKKE